MPQHVTVTSDVAGFVCVCRDRSAECIVVLFHLKGRGAGKASERWRTPLQLHTTERVGANRCVRGVCCASPQQKPHNLQPHMRYPTTSRYTLKSLSSIQNDFTYLPCAIPPKFDIETGAQWRNVRYCDEIGVQLPFHNIALQHLDVCVVHFIERFRGHCVPQLIFGCLYIPDKISFSRDASPAGLRYC